MNRVRLLAAIAAVAIAAVTARAELRLYVSPVGNDSWSGTLADPNEERSDGPMKTLEAARDRVREWRKDPANAEEIIRVEARAGVYRLEETLQFTAADSGADRKPTVFAAYEGESVRISGSREIPAFAPVTDAAVLERLPEEARGQVVQADLKALGITDYGSPEGYGLHLIFDHKPMTLARWPNEGFVNITELAGETEVDIRGTKGVQEGRWVYEGDRPRRWAAEADAWVHGYWFWDWSDQRQKVKSIDHEKRIIEVAPPYHHYGYRKGQYYYAYNLLSEIDQPGEWYLDRTTGVLYFWPPGDLAEAEAEVTVLDELVNVNDARHFMLSKLIFDGTRRLAISVNNGRGVAIVSSTVRNSGGDGIRLAGGTGNSVMSNELHQLGGTGISMTGGDRASLAPGEHLAFENHVHHYGQWFRMYRPAIAIDGVGHAIHGNLIHDAPHMAISFGGNDHIITNNEIYNVCLESNDAGAIYAGRDWTMRGTTITGNYLHNIRGYENKGCVGVYLDDMFCGTAISRNIFYRVTRAAFIGGGRDNEIEENVFIDCEPALHVDARALGWAADTVPTTMTERYHAMPVDSDLWREKYPELPGLLEDEPAAPKGNVIKGNVSIGGRWDGVYDEARKYVDLADNQVIDADAAKQLTGYPLPDYPSPEDIGTFMERLAEEGRVNWKRPTKPLEDAQWEGTVDVITSIGLSATRFEVDRKPPAN